MRLPSEFFSIEELTVLSGRSRRADIIAWLVEAQVPHVIGRHGWPLVYRTRLLPAAAQPAQNEAVFDYTAAHVPRRPAPLRG